MKPVKVTWRDITSQDGWRTLNQLENFITDSEENIVEQCGFLYEQDENQVVLLDSYFPKGGLYGGVHKIPKGCIIKMEELTSILVPER